MTVRVSPITDSDVPSAAAFLHTYLNSRVSVEAWRRSVDVPWKVDAPNHGFMLIDDEKVVGVYLAFYSERSIAGRVERICNLGAWCVAPDQRFHSVRLLKALLAQEDYHFLDLSPSGAVIPLNTRLKFQFLDTATALVPNLPWPSIPGRYAITDDPRRIEAILTGDELGVYSDHAATAAAKHVVLTSRDEWCYVIFRKDRRKNLPLFASILHVSNPALLHRMGRRFSRYLLVRHGVPATLAELRVVGARPAGSIMLRAPRRKMFKSETLRPEQIDYLYSELVCVAW